MKMTVMIIAILSMVCLAICQIIKNRGIPYPRDFRMNMSPVFLIVAAAAVASGLAASDDGRISCGLPELMPAAAAFWLMTSSLWESVDASRVVKIFLIIEGVLVCFNVSCAFGWLSLPSDESGLVFISLMDILIVAMLIYAFTTRLMDVKTVMKMGTVWLLVCLAVDVSYVLAFIAASALWQLGLESLAVLLMCGAVAGMGIRIMTDSEFVIWKSRERMIIESMKVTSVTTVADGSRIDQVYKDLYERIVAYFEAEKPYLNSNLTINELVRYLYSNKLYISRAISQFTGRNFCQYVNYHRVMHSMECFRENPEHKIHELATMSGFNSVVSYNMAFRLFMGENPSEWCRKEKSVLIKKKKLVVESQK